ncbi:SIMPL domain-containing protein [Sutterella sp.]|uniref:SIMPL domain-containing protein n=1 Tax=Sutterella sp. TaxID=1981025 RepID=UPI0026DF70C2|nr:SIMPL domain-containing protein [Sutterella sp.]MDO5532287.1 SIMPL domain-containing protein [Sutterella sp.]
MRATALKKCLAAAAVTAALAGFASEGALAMPRVAEAGLVMNLSGEATRTLTNDLAQLTFSIERRGKDSSAVTEEVVRAGNAAQEALKALGDKVEVKTTDFSTWPVMTRAKEGESSKISEWGVKQSIRVTVRDVKLASKVMEAAGRTMNFNGVTFSVSRPVRQATTDALLAEAIKNAGERAVIAAEALGLSEKNVRIEGIQVSGASGPAPRYYAQPAMAKNRLAAAADSLAPEVSSGTADVSLSVTLTVRIMP